MKALRNILTKLLNVLAGLSLIAMVALTCWQVFTRYILQHPSSWSEELVSYLFAWASLLGASLITGERGHMNIPVLVERMGMGAQKFFGILGEVIAFAFSAIILVYGGVQISQLAMGQMTSSLGVAVGIFYVCLLYTSPHQVLLQFQDLKRGTMIDLKDGVIGDLLMFCQLSFPVFFNDLPDFVHSFDHKHPGIPEVVFGTIPVFEQKRIILCIKGIYGCLLYTSTFRSLIASTMV